MKLTLATITNPAFVQAVSRLMQLPLAGKEAYWLAKSVRKLDTECKAFETARLTVLKHYGTEDGDHFKIVNPEAIEKANTEITELLKNEIELPLEKINLPETATMTASDLLVLDEIIAEPDKPAPAPPTGPFEPKIVAP